MHLNPGNTMTIKGDKFFNAHAVVLFMLIVFLSSATWAGPRPVTDYLRETLDQIIDALNDLYLRTPGKEIERINILLKVVKERFDEEEFARRALGAHCQAEIQAADREQ